MTDPPPRRPRRGPAGFVLCPHRQGSRCAAPPVSYTHLANGNAITDAAQTKATICSTTERANGAYATQNLITVFGDHVTISGLTIMPKVEVNKTIEVSGENFTLTNCSIVPNDKAEGAPADAGSLYFSGDKGTVVVEGRCV